MSARPPFAAATAAASGLRPTGSGWYGRLVDGAFAAFNSLRIVAYLPTLWAIAASADSSQHSLATWGIWLGANLSTALWLRRHGQGVGGAVLVSLGNAAMCAAAVVLIVALRS